MRKDTQAVLLLLVGATLLKISLAGTYLRYVTAGLLPLLVGTGLALVVVAGFTLWPEMRPAGGTQTGSGLAGPGEPDGDGTTAGSTAPGDAEPVSGGGAHRVGAHRAHAAYALHEGHRSDEIEAAALGVTDIPAFTGATMALPILSVDPAPPAAADRPGSGSGGGAGRDGGIGDDGDNVNGDDLDDGESGYDRGRAGWLLLVPALALLLFAPPALGSFQASRTGTALSTGAGSDFTVLPEGDPVRLGLLDYASRAVFDRGRTLTGRRVLLTGFVMAGPNGEPYLARMVVGCCAADGRPIKVGLTGNVPTDLQPDTWLEVEGGYIDHADRDPVNGELIPYLQVSAARAIAAPAEQYE